MRTPLSVVAIFCSTALAALSCGCTIIPKGRSAIDSVKVRGADQVSASDVEEKIATAPTPRFLGLFRGLVYDYELFRRATLERDLARVERFYRARGYYDAHATAGLVTRTSPTEVRVQIEVEEGPPVLIQVSKIEGAAGLPKEIVDALSRAAGDHMVVGKPFEEENFETAEKEVRRALTDRGYAYAKVDRDALVDIVRHTAMPIFTVAPGPKATFGKVTILGRTAESATIDVEIPEAPMRRAIDIEEGQPYSTAAIEDATRALLDLDVFSAVEVKPELGQSPSSSDSSADPATGTPSPGTAAPSPASEAPPPPPPSEAPIVPITVRVEPNRLRQLRLGGGLEFDTLKTDVHGFVGWEDKNFLGGLRKFSVEFRPGVVLYPTRLDNIVSPTRLLPEERLRLQLHQPGFLEARTHFYIRPEFNIFPLLVRSDDDTAQSVIGYREVRTSTWLERSYGKFYASVGYNIQIENPFAYKGPLESYLSTLVISYPEVVARLDFRDDRIHPHKGIYLASNVQFAGGPFGGTAGDFKTQPEIRTYIPLAPKITFATRGSVGFLFPRNYGDVVQNRLNEGITDDNRAERTRDIQTVLFRGFFSGGPSTNRGYPMRAISPHGVIPFLNPATASQQVASRCVPTTMTRDDPPPPGCSVPVGGFSLWELSSEIRFQVTGPLSAAVFVDMGDVGPTPGSLRFTHLHFSTGAGARYDTPVGPIRLDIGYRVQPLQVLGFRNEDEAARSNPTDGRPGKLFGAPIAIAFGIGEAY